jgi:creatinine amidohydrolase
MEFERKSVDMEDGPWQPRLANLTWVDVREFLQRTDTVIIPVGATEQHGPHLPLCTDSANIQAVAEMAARLERVFVAPTLVYGVSDNHMAFTGTITLRPRTLIDLILDIVRSLHRHGFRRLLLLNGHGGNNDAVGVAAQELRAALPDTVIAVADLAAFIYDGYEPVSRIIYHADEGETSHSLVVTPDLVRMDRALSDVGGSFLTYYRRYVQKEGDMTGRVSYGLPPTDSLSASGIMGDASAATVDAGARMHEVAVNGLCRILQDLKRTAATGDKSS